MPWETHGEITRPPKGFVKWFEWAYRPEGFKQVGCIYTAQGFEFDYVGVIIGDDLCFDPATNKLRADIDATEDPTLRSNKENFELHVKNIYRTLLTRGMRGCYVYFCNKETESFFRSRMASQAKMPSAETVPLLPQIPRGKEVPQFYPFVPEIFSDPGRERFVSLVPLYSLEAAAGSFGEPDAADCLGWVKAPSGIKINQRHFVAKIVGKSMEPKIKDGAYCLFSFGVIGSRAGRIVLAQHSDISDPETGGSYTIKKYQSKKIINKDGGWKHTSIQLLSLNPDFKPIEITAERADEIKVIAEFVAVLQP
jgi:phage repressor protein C with HTH and peptisase S24 domain